ncbi:hypothetical protein VSH64_24905 [Amycolatopsis rhabdoformis]|uniref:MuF-like minor capsid protein n=1 Tax=Amycolatopsis rhabdoformis TaxID=1448059 RepID=A0ABZ1HX05_9PSEU|nr:hypothetical protein [Amycolatopsis rhabdoformis]WSE26118.1 hypothetical protein VSH64_24905 [Amycolatopsis rhabdoformis]
MSSAREIALDHSSNRRRIAGAAARAGLAMWRQVDPANLTTSWTRLMARMFVVLQGAQLAAASTADAYAGEVLAAQEIETAPAGAVVPQALAGIASDGRDLLSLLLNPVISTKYAIGQGVELDRALARGAASLDMLVRTQVADAGRVADGVAVTVRPRTGYVRMLVGPSCARCVILAGRFYPYSSGFERHPLCDCTNIPSAEDVADDFTTDPMRAFHEGHVRGLSKADERAVRDGANLAQVVNARRGMRVAGSFVEQRADGTAVTHRGRVVSQPGRTTEGTTRFGLAGRRLGGQARLMPEQIYRDAVSRDEAVQLLRAHGYIV